MTKEYHAILKDSVIIEIRNYFIAYGIIYEDSKKRFSDGEEIRTSFINSIDLEKGLIFTKNTIYKIEGNFEIKV